jgi:hypothetical protein
MEYLEKEITVGQRTVTRLRFTLFIASGVGLILWMGSEILHLLELSRSAPLFDNFHSHSPSHSSGNANTSSFSSNYHRSPWWISRLDWTTLAGARRKMRFSLRCPLDYFRQTNSLVRTTPTSSLELL